MLVMPTADGSVAASVGGGSSSATTEEESARDLKDQIDGYHWYESIVWHLSDATFQGDGLRPARLIRTKYAHWDMEDVKVTCWINAVSKMAYEVKYYLGQMRKDDEYVHAALRAKYEQIHYQHRK